MDDTTKRIKHLFLEMEESGLDWAEAEAAISVWDNFVEPFNLLDQYDKKSIVPPSPVSVVSSLSASADNNESITADELIIISDEEQRRNGREVYELEPEHAYGFVNFIKRAFPKNGNFGDEQQKDALKGIINHVNLQLSEGYIYPTPLEKAAHLFYLVIKDHPFVDGNKRIALFLFCMYLERHSLGIVEHRVGYVALPAIALLVAVSDRGDMKQVVNVLMRLFYPQE